ncbi:MAG: nitrate- and nitrite sensing domain-containing protein [Gammaproteobacteria bacterium]|nr:nitrate- and nitrite sensing domain-containing protein [Gammaproteobacteria bacterium]
MTASLLFTLIFFGCIIFLWRQRQQVVYLETIIRGMSHVELARNLLEHLPQHRGMANALLNGDKSFQEKACTMQSTIDRDLEALKTAISSNAGQSVINTHQTQLETGWKSLKSDLKGLSAASSFERHTALITQVIYLISDIADEMRITAYPDETMRPIVHANLMVLPTMVEISGQARGIGAGVAAKGKITTALRIKIKFLHEHLNTALLDAHRTIETSLNRVKDKLHFDLSSLQASRTATQRLLDTIKDQLLKEEAISISASDYFAIGSAAFDNNLRLFDQLTQALKKDLQQRAPSLKSAHLRSIFFCAGLMAASSATGWWLLS